MFLCDEEGEQLVELVLLCGVKDFQEFSHRAAEEFAGFVQALFAFFGDDDFVGPAIVRCPAAFEQVAVFQVVDDAYEGGFVDAECRAELALAADLSGLDGGQDAGVLQFDAGWLGRLVGSRPGELVSAVHEQSKGGRVDRLSLHGHDASVQDSLK
ncbi:hypothetical protein GCM10010289_72610 [Streptomyces violascens]|nr:hypothetical protein GCM10010289_72610 [Streptomyces violascens]